jgi:hypothetical protein
MPYENSEHSPIRLGRRPETDRNDHYGAQQAGTRQPHKQYLSAVTWTVAAACLCPAGARQDAHRSTRTRGAYPAGHRVLAQPCFVRRKKFRLPKHVRKACVLLSGVALAEHPMAPPGGHSSLPNAGSARRAGWSRAAMGRPAMCAGVAEGVLVLHACCGWPTARYSAPFRRWGRGTERGRRRRLAHAARWCHPLGTPGSVAV